MKERFGKFIPEDFKESDAFSDAFNSQVDKPVKPEKGRIVKMSVAERKKGERDFNAKERLKNERQKSNTPEARARHKAYLDAFDARTDKLLHLRKEREKTQRPDAVARHKKVLDNFDDRTEDILAERKRSKLKMWKNLVETYLAGGEEAVEAELFDSNRAGTTLTKEMLEKDLSLQKQLAGMFVADSRKRTVEDFLVSMPTEEEYVVNVTKKINTKDDDQGIVSGEINNADGLSVKLPSDDILNELERVRKEREEEEFLAEFKNVQTPVEKKQELVLAEQAQDAYVEAYRVYDPKITKDKVDDTVALLRPPFFAFGSEAKKLKKLYTLMVERNNVAAISVTPEQITKNLAASDLVKSKSGITPELTRAATEINQEDQEVDWFANKQVGVNEEVDRLTQKRTFPLPSLKNIKENANKVKPGFTSPVIENFKRAKTVQEGIASLKEQQVEGIKKRLQEIEVLFADKNPYSKTKTVRQYLLGEDIKGWFKGEQKQLQQEYKNLYNSPTYQEWLKD
ncbi:MAG: hypothetical protein KBC69_02165 [Candidatus Magasanikbacteria bacterium]|nr:hypothetical protein [Candidatus Magasanikbacteria bacterium]